MDPVRMVRQTVGLGLRFGKVEDGREERDGGGGMGTEQHSTRTVGREEPRLEEREG
jgi:hypothetical protein